LTKASTCALEGKGDSSATEGCKDHQAVIAQRQRLIDSIDNSVSARAIFKPAAAAGRIGAGAAKARQACRRRWSDNV
jgi:hypothetical protein